MPTRIAVGGTDSATVRAVLDGLNAQHVEHGAEHPQSEIVLSLFRDGEDAPVGGLVGHVAFAWLFVRLFYLPADLRRQGLGADLLRQAEALARARGCVGVHLDTFDYQARGFYERLGYMVFGTLPDCPPGHARHFLAKRLD